MMESPSATSARPSRRPRHLASSSCTEVPGRGTGVRGTQRCCLHHPLCSDSKNNQETHARGNTRPSVINIQDGRDGPGRGLTKGTDGGPRDRNGSRWGQLPQLGFSSARKLQPTDAKELESRPHRRPAGGALTPSKEAHGAWEGGNVKGCRANSGGPAARGGFRDRERDEGFPSQPNPASPPRAVQVPPLQVSGPTFSAAPID